MADEQNGHVALKLHPSRFPGMSGKMAANQLKGHPAEDLARLCFSKLRFYPVSLKDRLRRDGLWEDLAQELYRIALEGWRQGLTAREMGGMATREIRAFLKAYGFQRRQGKDGDGFVRSEEALSTWDGAEDRLLARAEPVPTGGSWGDRVEKAILALLQKHPSGLTQCQVNQALRRLGWAAVVSDQCARLVVRGLIKEVPRPKGNGRPASPMLVAAIPSGRARPGFSWRERWRENPQQAILAFLRGNGGVSKRDLYTRLVLTARELDGHCAPLIEQGLIHEVKRQNASGRWPTPLLVAGPAPEAETGVDKRERIRQAYLQGKAIKQIAREFHHARKTVRKAIAPGLASRR